MESWPVALTVFAVFLREGVEVMILLCAMNIIAKHPLPIFAGGAIGVAISIAAGVAIGNMGKSIIAENSAAIVSAALMIYLARSLIFWQFSGDVEKASLVPTVWPIAKRAWLLFGLATLTAGRETVDLMIFVDAVTVRTGWSVHVMVGIAVAGLCLVVVYSVLDRLAGKLPLRLIFIVSSIWLVVQAALLIWDVFE